MTTFKGTAVGEALLGGKSDDELLGFAGNDTLTGGPGDDYLDGGADSDTAEYTGLITEYGIGYDEKSGELTITDNVSDRDGIDTVTGVETFNFGKATKTLAEMIALATGAVVDDYAADSSTTGSIAVGASTSGNIEQAGDEDWFALTLLAGQSYTFTLDAATTAGLGNPKLWLYTGKGAVLDSNDNATASSLNSQISFTATTGGTFYLGATASDSIGTGAYSIGVTTSGPAPNHTPTGSVVITGTATQGQTLTATNTLADADGLGTIAYQWKADGVAIAGANGNSYALLAAQVGKLITVTASYTDSYGNSESVTSSATSTVAAPAPVPTPLPSVDGVSLAELRETTAAGATSTTLIISAVPSTWKPGTNSTSTTQPEIPLASDSSGKSVLKIGVPIGIGLSSETLSGGADSTSSGQLTALMQAKTGTSGATFAGLQNHIDAYIPTVRAGQQLTVRSITFDTTTGTPNQPIVVTGEASTDDSSGRILGAQEAIVLDTRGLASGTTIQLDNVEFAFVIGSSRVTGGQGHNYVVGDAAAQDIVLGPEDDTLYGGDGNDHIGSLGGNDQLFGDGGNDTVEGGIGNDTLTGGAGNDTLDGGNNVDTAMFSGNIANYVLTRNGNSYTVQANTGTDGLDTISNIEKIQFADGTAMLAADMTNTTPDGSSVRSLTKFDDTLGQRMEKFFLAYYGRPADYAGLAYWKDTLTGALANNQLKMASYFGNATQTEFVNLYGANSTDAAFLTAVYQNLFSHGPDTAGLNYWLSVIGLLGTTQSEQRANVVIAVLDGAGAADAAIVSAKVANMTALSKQIATYDLNNAFGDASNSTAFSVMRNWTQAQLAGTTTPEPVLRAVNEKAIASAPVGGNAITTSASYTLPGGFVNLKLTGTASLAATGNSADNLIYGNSAGSSLTGGGGTDCFIVQSLPGTPDRVTDFSAGDLIAVDTAGFSGLKAGAQTLQTYGNVTGTTAALLYDPSSGTLYFDADGTGSQTPTAILAIVGAPALGAASVWGI